MKQQAKIELQKGEIAKSAVDRERDIIRRNYEAEAGRNRSMLATGNVDLSSGSASDSLLGNAMLFSEDYGANRYNHAVANWEAGEQARQASFKASQFESQSATLKTQSSWLRKSAGGIGNSLLAGGLGGATGFLNGYTASGGTIFKPK